MTASLPKVFNHIRSRHLKGDLFGGVTAAVIALPMALAFGVASGAGAAALFGGTPTLISEPTGPMTVVMTAVIASFTASYPEKGLAMAFTVVMLAGVFQIIFGLLKLGRDVTQRPDTVSSGFMSGIGIILIILQIGPFLGHAIPRGGVMGTLTAVPQLVAAARLPEVLLGAITLAILWLTPAVVKKVAPPQLIALILGTVLSLTLINGERGADLEGIRRIGQFASGFPSFQVPYFELGELRLMLIDAAVLGMFGCIDALLTAVISDSLTRTESDSNKELIGQGLGNLASGVFGGIAGAGISRALVLMLVILVGGPLAAQIPQAVVEAVEKGRNVFVVGASDRTRRRLEQLRMYELLPPDHTEIGRREALERAVAGLA